MHALCASRIGVGGVRTRWGVFAMPLLGLGGIHPLDLANLHKLKYHVWYIIIQLWGCPPGIKNTSYYIIALKALTVKGPIFVWSQLSCHLNELLESAFIVSYSHSFQTLLLISLGFTISHVITSKIKDTRYNETCVYCAPQIIHVNIAYTNEFWLHH